MSAAHEMFQVEGIWKCAIEIEMGIELGLALELGGKVNARNWKKWYVMCL